MSRTLNEIRWTQDPALPSAFCVAGVESRIRFTDQRCKREQGNAPSLTA